MLLLIDLDNTLIDRSAAFGRWATRWAPAHGGGPADVDWLIATDNDGFEPRERFATRISERFSRLGETELGESRLGEGMSAGDVLGELRAGMVEQLEPDPEVGRALAEAVAVGWSPVVVTNGSVRQQEAKLRRTGPDRLVTGWVISEGAGVRKPDRRIFELAAELAGLPLTGWMIGDHPEYDIGGGSAAGLRTGWLARDRVWPDALPYRPTLIADDCVSAIRGVI
jgi:putative hydrolase of the HAD superfamily